MSLMSWYQYQYFQKYVEFLEKMYMASYQDFFFNLLRKQKAPSDVADAAIVKATPITA